MKILFISAEVFPFAKRGGLADVVGSLPKILAQYGHDVRVMMPAYRSIEEAYHEGRWGLTSTDIKLDVPINGSTIESGVFTAKIPNSTVPVYFIAKGDLLGRPEIYGYSDDAYRFAYFSRAALQLAVEELEWRPDVVHAHDWHTAPAVTWLATAGASDPRYQNIPTVFTIHNLAHQGKTSWHITDYLQIITHSLEEEAYDTINFMARAIYHATKVNTVSPTYAQEITTRQGGADLDGLLRYRKEDLHGILNGLDYEVWNPEKDQHLAQTYTADTLSQRAANKAALQKSLGLPQRDDIPLISMISRLDWQKGLDLMGEAVHRLLEGQSGEAQFVLLGSGDAEYEEMFTQFMTRYPDKASVTLAYRADLAPLIYAGSDMFLMPSLFEPCGLGQLISMRYGCIPIVRATGGLADTVWDEQTGFVFDGYDSGSFWRAIQRATYTYNTDQPYWQNMVRQAMQQDFSWHRSAREYEALYEEMSA